MFTGKMSLFNGKVYPRVTCRGSRGRRLRRLPLFPCSPLPSLRFALPSLRFVSDRARGRACDALRARREKLAGRSARVRPGVSSADTLSEMMIRRHIWRVKFCNNAIPKSYIATSFDVFCYKPLFCRAKHHSIAAIRHRTKSYPVEDCKLGVTQNEQILGVVLSYMRENGVRPYDETTGRGLVRHVLIRYGFTSKELMVCLVINRETLPQEKKLVDALCKIEGMTSISVNINRKNTNVILGEETRTVWGSDYITDQIHLRDCDHDFALTDTAIAYHISPQSFYQVNPVQTEKLYSLALSYAGLTGRETVWDLYCGIGTISLFLAQKAGKVYGVEIVPQAIEDARSNAALNGITNASFFVGKAEEVLPEFYEKESRKPDADMLHPDVIVVDPPRKGCDEKCLETMLRMEPDRIVYVSCDPATLARDLKILCGGGYELRKVRPVDQFGHTTHVETVCLLSN